MLKGENGRERERKPPYKYVKYFSKYGKFRTAKGECTSQICSKVWLSGGLWAK